jgi:hypothetical protein
VGGGDKRLLFSVRNHIRWGEGEGGGKNSWKRRETCERIYKARAQSLKERDCKERGRVDVRCREGDKRGTHAKKPTSCK